MGTLEIVIPQIPLLTSVYASVNSRILGMTIATPLLQALFMQC
jgi:hypothetical protein